MSNCPLTGQPCSYDKMYQITDITKEGVQSSKFCHKCLNNLLKLEPICPFCQTGIREILKLKIGCPNCYDWFEKELGLLIPRLQDGGTKHVGKNPKKYNLEDIEFVLNEKLKFLIDSELYEDAAICRDQIKIVSDLLSEKNILVQKLKKALEQGSFLELNRIKNQISCILDTIKMFLDQ